MIRGIAMSRRAISCLTGLAAFSIVGGCGALPRHAQTTQANPSSLVIVGGPAGATVLVDNVEAGALLPGRTVLPVADGSHVISVRLNGVEVHRESVFLQDGTRRLISLGK